MNVFIVGGNSGLGLEIGKLFNKKGWSVIVTGRSKKQIPKEFIFHELDITDDNNKLKKDLDKIILDLPTLDLFIYAAGFFEAGHIADLSDAHISKMTNVGFVGPALLLQRIMKKQKKLAGFIAITSTSQWRARELEPLYTGTKAGLALLAKSTSLDPNIYKTLVVGPAGMNTSFWTDTGRDAKNLLSPTWVALQILKLWNDTYTFRMARILRDPTPEPDRIQILETD